MRVKIHDVNEGEIVLSRRNLMTLLAKLDGHPPDSKCSIKSPIGYGDWTVRAEEDDVHYSHPDRAEVVGDSRPGPMHPDTEAALAAKAEDDAIEAARLR